MTATPVDSYLTTLHQLVSAAKVTDGASAELTLQQGTDAAIKLAKRTASASGKLMFIGNGGSAAIASHLAVDFTKNGGMPALALNDAAVLTCLGNDFGFDHVFDKQIEAHGRDGDVLVAISSSGKSRDILLAVEAARTRGMKVLTFSGFRPDNPLRRLGDLNFYVANDIYGFVEIAHLTLCHAILDLAMGWTANATLEPRRLLSAATI